LIRISGSEALFKQRLTTTKSIFKIQFAKQRQLSGTDAIFINLLAAITEKNTHGTSEASEKNSPRVPAEDGISIRIPDDKPIEAIA
jgi:hypothetical protein